VAGSGHFSNTPFNLLISHMQPVLILGAGINGAALARELILNGIPVWIVDCRDIAAGASSRSSHLIHGGLRYLEYGEFDLVRESLAERRRLLRLAPQFVQPLELFIPVTARFAGIAAAALKFLKLKRSANSPRRGLWLVQMGLWLYYKYAQDNTIPRPRTLPADSPEAVPVDTRRYGWQCSYYDALVEYPERFTLSFLEDASAEAARQGIDFRLWTYHEARREDRRVQISRVGSDEVVAEVEPSCIVNATGASVDETLKRLAIDSRQLMGGTKGSHLHTCKRELVEKLAGRGLYAEAADGRPVFILPWADGVLIGTTDLPYHGNPLEAVASDDEIEYLVATVNEVLGPGSLSRDDIDWHFCGVRPLPAADPRNPAAITRRHWLERNEAAPVPTFSVIGGKLTTCRSLAETSTAQVLEAIGCQVKTNSQERALPGGFNYPDKAQVPAIQEQVAAKHGLSVDEVRAMWRLVGNRVDEILTEAAACDLAETPVAERVAGTMLPRRFARWVIRHEWVETLDDLVCRRLMVITLPNLKRETLEDLAELMAAEGKLAGGTAQAVDETIATLQRYYGKRVS